jgi:S1-C subfamily serine protease
MLLRRRSLRERVLGGERNLGLWILPLFLLTATLGATAIGGLAVLYYGQQVRQLERTTAEARARLDETAAQVNDDVKRGREAINAEVREGKEALAQRPPISDPNKVGVFSASARHPDGTVKVATAFAVYSDQVETYLLTTRGLIATPDGGTVESAEVFLPDQTASVRVHAVDVERDLALLVAQGGPVPVPRWRPVDDTVATGDSVFVVGIAGSNTPVLLPARVAGVSDRAIIPDVPLNEFVAGGPLVDAAGDVVAVASLTYAPFGVVEGDLRYAVPIRGVCELLLDCTENDLGG